MMCTVRETILFANVPRGIRAAPVCVFSTSQNIPIPKPIRAKRIRSRVGARRVALATSAPAHHLDATTRPPPFVWPSQVPQTAARTAGPAPCPAAPPQRHTPVRPRSLSIACASPARGVPPHLPHPMTCDGAGTTHQRHTLANQRLCNQRSALTIALTRAMQPRRQWHRRRPSSRWIPLHWCPSRSQASSRTRNPRGTPRNRHHRSRPRQSLR